MECGGHDLPAGRQAPLWLPVVRPREPKRCLPAGTQVVVPAGLATPLHRRHVRAASEPVLHGQLDVVAVAGRGEVRTRRVPEVQRVQVGDHRVDRDRQADGAHRLAGDVEVHPLPPAGLGHQDLAHQRVAVSQEVHAGGGAFAEVVRAREQFAAELGLVVVGRANGHAAGPRLVAVVLEDDRRTAAVRHGGGQENGTVEHLPSGMENRQRLGGQVAGLAGLHQPAQHQQPRCVPPLQRPKRLKGVVHRHEDAVLVDRGDGPDHPRGGHTCPALFRRVGPVHHDHLMGEERLVGQEVEVPPDPHVAVRGSGAPGGEAGARLAVPVAGGVAGLQVRQRQRPADAFEQGPLPQRRPDALQQAAQLRLVVRLEGEAVHHRQDHALVVAAALQQQV